MKPLRETLWKNELNNVAFRYHVIVLWVAIILDPLWAIGDYFTIPNHFIDFLIFRLVVSIACLITLFYRNKFKVKTWVLALVPFIGIGIQNAYMYSVMEIPELQKHTFAFIALFIGAGMLLLWEIKYSLITIGATLLTTIVLMILLSPLTADEIMINGGLLTATVGVFTIVLIQTRYKLTIKEIIARLSLIEINAELEDKNGIIEEHNRDMRDSIVYSKRIQEAILPKKEILDKTLLDYFIFYQSKDIIGGDFYWCTEVNTTPIDGTLGERIAVMAVVDCTGHGVPGALMSIIGNTILNQSIKSKDVNSPAQALDYLNLQLNNNLKEIRDGMDISIIAINFNSLQLQYAGANNPIYIVRNRELEILKPDKQAIGNDSDHAHNKKFTNKLFSLKKGDMIYLFTDGYADQFGHSKEVKEKAKTAFNDESLSDEELNQTILGMMKGKKFGYKRFQQLLLDISELNVDEQQKKLTDFHQNWKGDLEQVDDICVVGIKI